MSIRFDRRRFLSFFPVAGSGLLIGCTATNPDSYPAPSPSAGDAGSDAPLPGSDAGPPPGAGKDVVVIGGGLAGLASAYELRKKGYNVVAILEAQDRTGGRVFTQRAGFKNNQYAEYGATRIADTHNFTLAYAQEMGLTLREFTSGNALYHIKNKSWVHQDGDAWPTDVFPLLAGEDRTLGADSLVLKYEKLAELGDPLRSDWTKGKALEYNDLGIEAYLKRQGASDDVITIDRAINGTELKQDGALYWLMADVVDAKWDKTFAIAGGNDKLPKAFTERLGELVKYSCVVTKIAQDAKSVTVTFTSEGATKTVTADLCVCAIPFSTLKKIDLTGASFSAEKTDVITTLEMMPVGRGYMQTKSRFWTNDARGAIGGLKVARTDTAMERLWHTTDVQDGDSGILLSYTQGENATAFGDIADAEKANYLKNGTKAFFPQIETELDSVQYKIWQKDPWTGGGWAFYKPGEMKTKFPAAKKREGRIFFCGEHTSPWSGWMQGAFESANRVVAEITA